MNGSPRSFIRMSQHDEKGQKRVADTPEADGAPPAKRARRWVVVEAALVHPTELSGAPAPLAASLDGGIALDSSVGLGASDEASSSSIAEHDDDEPSVDDDADVIELPGANRVLTQRIWTTPDEDGPGRTAVEAAFASGTQGWLPAMRDATARGLVDLQVLKPGEQWLGRADDRVCTGPVK